MCRFIEAVHLTNENRIFKHPSILGGARFLPPFMYFYYLFGFSCLARFERVDQFIMAQFVSQPGEAIAYKAK